MGWAALRAVFRRWEVHEREQLSVWMRRQGFPAVLMSEACRVDGRVALLEAVYVVIAIHMGRGGVVPPDRAFGIESRRTVGRPPVPTTSVDSNWLQLDQVSLEEIFALRIPMLKSCPHFLRGRVRESFNFALRERFKARLEGNVEAETRAWKLFGLIPIMLLHKPYGTGSVGRSELGHRVGDFARGSHSAGDVSTLDELTRRRPQERRQQIPAEVLDFVPDGELRLDTKQFAECLRSAPSGSSPGLVDVPTRFSRCVQTTGRHCYSSLRLPKTSHAQPFLEKCSGRSRQPP